MKKTEFADHSISNNIKKYWTSDNHMSINEQLVNYRE
jgi:hypothetical protein